MHLLVICKDRNITFHCNFIVVGGWLCFSNGQLRTERYGDTEKGCQNPAVQQKTTDDDDVILLQITGCSVI